MADEMSWDLISDSDDQPLSRPMVSHQPSCLARFAMLETPCKSRPAIRSRWDSGAPLARSPGPTQPISDSQLVLARLEPPASLASSLFLGRELPDLPVVPPVKSLSIQPSIARKPPPLELKRPREPAVGGPEPVH